ncbi:MAG TPA: iron-containing redox enzyme family protein [Pusillimonas sp.]|uniref:iron-containing redox enzyme family protein n=1 Tax=unclassified Pusillimonas TaxID=2640016 RepID=UPI002627E425|nr:MULTISPECIES: iron-containing redox enzyme family protein [unclassified Pusillimonas]HLU19833.1 iron-containing redox enzyme family protein [Pusillimonas sp.]
MSALPIYRSQSTTAPALLAQDIYGSLYEVTPRAEMLEAARAYLEECMEQAQAFDCDLPAEPAALEAWMKRRHDQVGRQYLDYLKQRKLGAPRRYFSNRAHVLYFLQGVAPTKFVDGAWLYGLLPQWQDDRFRALIRIYLEELGEGRAADNHVSMYRRLLAVNGCEHLMPLSDGHYVQGAIQLCLARLAAQFMPEVVGFNLGYEQLPLHLLITTYEMKELGLDPYYFQVHVTVDNAGTGHARKALESVNVLRPAGMDTRHYFERVRRGYRLNDLGQSTLSVIKSFDIDKEVVRVLADKAEHGQHMHSDYCRFGGKTVNEWLSNPESIAGFLEALERQGWIKRNQDPKQSRFWRLLEDEGSDMFGVFSGYERQVIHDWIAGDWQEGRENRRPGVEPVRIDKKLAQRWIGRDSDGSSIQAAPSDDDFGVEMRDFETAVMRARSRPELMERLSAMMGPSSHHTPVGFAATRMYGRLLDMA